ncbi:uncharacterized protein LOC118734182 isoform X2 [Rhagoletis pomonella]|nr:uncharacterized protein LOC118734182 isoform X2 [Rhagoletis pomonella]
MQNRALKHLNSKDEQVLLEGEKRCENCKRLEDKIDQKFQELADRTNHQNTIIMEALAEQNVLINRTFNLLIFIFSQIALFRYMAQKVLKKKYEKRFIYQRSGS